MLVSANTQMADESTYRQLKRHFLLLVENKNSFVFNILLSSYLINKDNELHYDSTINFSKLVHVTKYLQKISQN